MKKEIIDIVKEAHSDSDYNYHILPVVKNALMLGKKLNADLELVETAAYLHDIGRAGEWKDYSPENEHHILGAEKAKEILKGFGYEEKFIDDVAGCILSHRGRKEPNPVTLEEKIISCADAMSHFNSFLELFRVFSITCSSFEEAVLEVEKKIDRAWDKKLIFPEAKEMVKDNYNAIKIIINNMKDYLDK